MCCTGLCLSACCEGALLPWQAALSLPALCAVVFVTIKMHRAPSPPALWTGLELLPCACWLRNLERKQRLICFGLLLPIFFQNKTLGVFSVSICELPGKDLLLLVKVWPLCAISGVPVLPMCTCDWEHRDGIASSTVLQRTVSPSKVQTLLQNWALSSPLWLCWGYSWGWVLKCVSLLVPTWLLLALLLLSHPLLPFFFPSLLPCLWYRHGVLTQSSPQMLCNCFFSIV